MPVSLLHPWLFAIGLACVSIPILIHLLKRRRRVVSWGAMRFLEEAYRKRRRIITLEQLVLLSLRCLLLVLIALGVGSLMLGSGNRGSEPTTLVIVLDDSIGSGIEVDGQAAFDSNSGRAIAAIESLDPARGDRVALISASMPAQAIVFPPSDDMSAVTGLIQQARPSDAGLDMGGVMRLLGELEPDDERPTRQRLMFASDGRTLERAMSQIEEQPAPIAFDELLLSDPAAGTALNVGVVRAQPTRSMVVREGMALPEAVRVELVRSGAGLDEQVSTLRVLDERSVVRGQAQISWAAGQRELAQTVAIESQGLRGTASTSSVLRVELGADANPRDNSVVFTLPVRNTLRVGVIDRPVAGGLGRSGGINPSKWARAALSPGGGVGIEVVGIDASQAQSRLVPNLDAVLVLAPAALQAEAWERLARMREQGSMLIITPDAQSDSLAWFERVREIAPESFESGERIDSHSPELGVVDRVDASSLLAGISGELPVLAGAVDVYRSLSLAGGGTPIVTLSDGSALGVQIMHGDGTGPIVLLAVPLDLNWSNLPARPLFVAMMQELVRQGVGQGAAANSIVAGEPLPEPVWVQSVLPLDVTGRSGPIDQDLGLNQRAGLLAMRDAQGTVRGLTIVRPDSAAAIADVADRERVRAQFEGLIEAPSVSWTGDESAASGVDRARVSSADARSLALNMLWAAVLVAVAEFILARLFTARLIASERAMGANSGGGARA